MIAQESENIREIIAAIDRIFETECSDYPNRSAGVIERLWAIEQAAAGRRLALQDMHNEMREGYKTL